MRTLRKWRSQIPITIPSTKCVNSLLKKAKKSGKIDQREIFTGIPDKPENIDLLDALYADLAEANVEISGINEPSPDDLSDEWVLDDGEEVDLNAGVYLDDVADDSVRLYLRENWQNSTSQGRRRVRARKKKVVEGDKKSKRQDG